MWSSAVFGYTRPRATRDDPVLVLILRLRRLGRAASREDLT